MRGSGGIPNIFPSAVRRGRAADERFTAGDIYCGTRDYPTANLCPNIRHLAEGRETDGGHGKELGEVEGRQLRRLGYGVGPGERQVPHRAEAGESRQPDVGIRFGPLPNEHRRDEGERRQEDEMPGDNGVRVRTVREEAHRNPRASR